MPGPGGGVTLSFGSMFGILMNIAGALALAVHAIVSVAVAWLVARLTGIGLLRAYWAVCAYVLADAAEGRHQDAPLIGLESKIPASPAVLRHVQLGEKVILRA